VEQTALESRKRQPKVTYDFELLIHHPIAAAAAVLLAVAAAYGVDALASGCPAIRRRSRSA